MKKWNMYSLSAYRFGMTAEELSYMEVVVDGWNDDENYATDVETIATVRGWYLNDWISSFPFNTNIKMPLKIKY